MPLSTEVNPACDGGARMRSIRTGALPIFLSMITSALRLFRVYSPFCASLVERVWAYDNADAVRAAREKNRKLARYDNLRAFPA